MSLVLDAVRRGWARAQRAVADPPGAERITDFSTLTPRQAPIRVPAGTFRQPDRTTCGSATLVMSRMCHDPAYATWLLTGDNPAAGETLPNDQTPEDRFRTEALSMHARTNALTARRGGLQLPWPRAIGTQPWALAHEMSGESGAGVPGTEYGVRVIDPGDRGRTFDEIVAASGQGHTVPVFIGNRSLPRHVVLATASSADSLTVYEPSIGLTVTATRDHFLRGALDIAGWDEPWFAITPC